MIKISFLYPNSRGGRFDLQYYLEKHMRSSIDLLSVHPGSEVYQSSEALVLARLRSRRILPSVIIFSRVLTISSPPLRRIWGSFAPT